MKKSILFNLILVFSLFSVSAEKIIFSANHMTGKAGDSNTTTALTGNAYIKTETMEIQADNIELSGEDYRYIKATGKITGKNLETNMSFTCDNLEYDRTTKVADLKGNVDLEDIDNKVKAKAQIIVYDQNTDIAVMQIQINLTQEDNVCSGSYAVYYKKNQILELSGNAQVKQKDDVFRAQFITLNMDTQDITLGGNVKGTVRDTKPAKKSSGDQETENVETEKKLEIDEQDKVEENTETEQEL